jgi:maleamate amidohydrolase
MAGAKENLQSGTLGFGQRPALVVVDFVEAYLRPGSPLYAGVESTRDACAELLAKARAAAIPIFHTKVEYEPGGRDGGLFFRKLPALAVLERGSPLGAFAAGVEPKSGETVLTKQYPSAFFGTSLDAMLNELGVDSLLVAGLTTSGCVRATVVDAMQLGFVPIVVQEAVGDRDPAPHNANLFDMRTKYADVVTLEAAGAFLDEVADRV